MLFQGEDSSLELTVAGYELQDPDGSGDEKNWLVLRCTWHREDGSVRKDSCGCIRTYELTALNAGLKVLRAGLRNRFESELQEPWFTLQMAALPGERFSFAVSFYLPNTMDGEDTAEVEGEMSPEELRGITEELDRACRKYPDRV